MRVAAVQLSPVLLDRAATLEKILAGAQHAAAQGARLAAFPEAILPGYPCWLEHTGGARFDDPLQKALFARYLDQALELPGPELDRLLEAARDLRLALVVGVMERGAGAGRGTLYCTALSIGADGAWHGHRKLVPTYEERLAWGWGDGHGLRLSTVEGWRVGALNCWENWMPAARLALYSQGEELHVSLWPGRPANTRETAAFQAREGRVYVVAASGVLRAEEVPSDLPHLRLEMIC
jgi:nitrilase